MVQEMLEVFASCTTQMLSLGKVQCPGSLESSFLSHLFPQVSTAAGEWADSGVYSGPVLQGQAQAGSALPPPPVFTSWAGAETHLPSSGGKSALLTEEKPKSSPASLMLQCSLAHASLRLLSLCVFLPLKWDESSSLGGITYHILNYIGSHCIPLAGLKFVDRAALHLSEVLPVSASSPGIMDAVLKLSVA